MQYSGNTEYNVNVFDDAHFGKNALSFMLFLNILIPKFE